MGFISYGALGKILGAIGSGLETMGAPAKAASRQVSAAGAYFDGIQGAVEGKSAVHIIGSIIGSTGAGILLGSPEVVAALLAAPGIALLPEALAVIAVGAIVIVASDYIGELIGDSWDLGAYLTGKEYDLAKKFGRWLRKHDPLVLDLDGNGLTLTSVDNSQTYFNFGGGDFSSRTGWVGGADGFLALDRNGNGRIDGISELFGTDNSDGFNALAELDTNHDGIINANDAQFNELQVWRDQNTDGVAQDSEVGSLASLNISSISLATTQANLSIAGNSVPLTSVFTKSDGTQSTIGAVYFADSLINTHYQPPEGFFLDPEVFGLPNLRGYGSVPDLWVAMSLDPTLKQMVKDLVNKGKTIASLKDVVGGTTGNVFTANQGGLSIPDYQEHDFERMMYRWSQVVPGPASNFDVSALADFSGGDPNIQVGFMTTTNYINRTVGAFIGRNIPNWTVFMSGFYDEFQQFATDYALRFYSQVSTLDVAAASYTVGQNFAALPASPSLELITAAMQPLADAIANPTQQGALVQSLSSIQFDQLHNAVAGDPSPYIDLLLTDESWSPEAPWSGYNAWGAEHRHELDSVDPSRRAAELGMRRLTSNLALPVLRTSFNGVDGTSGADILLGTDGATPDLLKGGPGDDLLRGFGGNDTYVFSDDCGTDVVTDTAGNDEVAFQGTLMSALARFSFANGNRADLQISFEGRAERVTIQGYFDPSGNATIETLSFADGVVVDPRAVRDAVFSTLATDQGDIISGFGTSETLVGRAGDDIIDGMYGDDIIIGGPGNDTLYGSGGNDTYRFARGDGQDIIHERGAGYYGGNDTIEYAAGVAPSDVVVTQSADGNDLILKIAGTTDQVTIANDMNNSDYRVEQVKFADGTVWSHADLVQRSIANDVDGTVFGSSDGETVIGTAGDDIIDGMNGDDIIIGGTGNDTLYGSGGNDTYRFARGDGQDVIIERGAGYYGGNDSIEFAAGISVSDITVTQANGGQDLVLKINGTTDQITIKYTLSSTDDRVEQVKFADGSMLSHAQLVQLSIANNGGNDTFYGSYDSETIDGGAGDDIIDGRAGNDIIIGGTGNDTLYGSGGDDTFRFARGDGQDVIIERGVDFYGGNDSVEFAAGISASDITVTQANGGQDIILKINGTTDQVTLKYTLSNGDDRIEQVKFADGTIWSTSEIVQRSSGGTPGNDTLYGDTSANVIDGGAGDDIIDGRYGDDVIIGGTGNDTLYGSGGNDTFRFARGDGQDIIIERGVDFYGGNDSIEFAAGISASDLTVTQANGGQDLVLKINGTADQITIKYTLSNSDYRVEQVKFADGSMLTHAQLVQLSMANNSGNDTFYGSYDSETIDGGAGDDILDGREGNDIIIGGTGNDTLYGSGGDDTFRFARGDGQDIIIERGVGFYGGNDTLEFAAGISASDVTVKKANDGQDLVLRIVGTTDQITLKYTLTNGDDLIEQVKFADGTIWTSAELVQRSAANTSGNVTLNGDGSNNVLTGGAGDDTLYGNGGDDILIGGTGDDTLSGGGGNDIYRFARGDGQDVIFDAKAGGYGGNDTLEFAAGIASSDITVVQSFTGDLILKINGTTDQVTLANDMNNGDNRIEQVRFADGSVLTHAQLMQMSMLANGGNNTFFGSYDSETIDGGAGDDTLYGSYGDDILIGGTGNDTLSGGGGNDTYRFARGDGQDVIYDALAFGYGGNDTLEFAAGIAASDITVTQGNNGNDLILKINGTTDQVTLANDMNNSDNRIEQVRFADGSVLTHAQLMQMSMLANGGNNTFFGSYDSETIDGGAGDDTLYGSYGDDILIGGTGDDTLSGGGGNDTYRFARGDGQDVVFDAKSGGYGGNDTLEIAAGIAASDITVTQGNNGNDLILKINGTTDQVTLAWTINYSDDRIEQVRFADGTVLTHAQLLQRSLNWAPVAAAGSTLSGAMVELASVTGSTASDTVSGAIKFNDADPTDVHSLTVASVSATGVIAGLPTVNTMLAWLTQSALVEPSGSTAGSIGWTFASPDSMFDYLGAGQIATLTYVVQVSDGNGGTLNQNVTLTITGSNDAPLIAAGSTVSGPLTELISVSGSSTSDTVSGTLKFSDAEAADVHSATISSLTATGVTSGLPSNATMLAWLTKSALTEAAGSTPGSVGWTFAAPDSMFDYLGAGQIATLTYVVQVSDGNGGTLNQNVTLTVTGSNDAPLVAAGSTVSGALTELVSVTGSATSDTVAGVIKFTDADIADLHSATIASVSATGVTSGLPANATMLAWLSKSVLVEAAGSSPGLVGWTFAAPDSIFDYLGAAQVATLTYVVQIGDGNGGMLSQNVTLTVTGSNDAPLIAAGTTASGALTELASVTGSPSNDTITGSIKFTDADAASAHTATIASVSATGVTSGLPANATTLAWLTKSSLVEAAGSTPGSVGWTFAAPDSMFDYLGAGQVATLTYLVQVADGNGGTLSQNVTLTVTGSNDVPLIAAGTTASGALTELASVTGSSTSDTVSGSIKFSDADMADVHTATIASVSATGVTAGLPSNATVLAWLTKSALVEAVGSTPGSVGWTFAAPDSMFDYLGAGQAATLTYVVQIADGNGGTLSQNVTLTVTGSNDAPLIAAGSTVSGALTELASVTGSATSDTVAGVIKFTDADTVDLHSATIASVAATGITSGLPANATMLAWLTKSALTEAAGSTPGSVGWTFAAPDSMFDYLGAGQVATLTYVVQITDGNGGMLSQNVTLTVTGSNDVPLIAAGTTASGGLTELARVSGSSTSDTVSGSIKFTDADTADIHTATIASVAASGVTSGLPVNATLLSWLSKSSLTEAAGSTTGSVGWTFAAPDSMFDYLGAGQVATLTYVVQIADGNGGTLSQNVTLTVTGSNDAPLIAGPGTLTIRSATATRVTGLSISDGDANVGSETVTITTTLGTTAATATGGTTVTGSASKSLKITGTIAAINATLATLTYTSASTGSDTISVATSDGTVTTTKAVAVTVNTTANSAPTIDATTTASGAVTELAGTYNSATADTATGTVRFMDAEVPDTHTMAVSSVAATGNTSGLPANATLLTYLTKGAVTEASGTTPGAVTWTFSAADKTFDYLGAGQTTILTYVLTVTDSKGGSVTQNVTITVTGTNDAAVIATGSTTTGAITELASVTNSAANNNASGSIKFTDETNNTHSRTITGVTVSGTTTSLPANATMLAWLSVGALTEPVGATAGSLPWTFTAPDSAFDYLSSAQTATLTYTVQITDDLGAVMSQNVVVTVTGSNDNPVATSKSGFTTDNWTALTITGATLLAGATDPDKADTLTLSSVQGAVGGTVALTSGNAVFTPTASAIGPASFTYTISDGKGGTSTATASLTTTLHQINGTTAADTLSGNSTKKAQLDGLAGNDTITAGGAGDTLIGGAGNDAMTAGAGIDTFVFHAGFGIDTITGFAATGTSHDIIQVDKTLFADWAHLLGATTQVGADLKITYDAADTITLKNVTLANFTSADAVFV